MRKHHISLEAYAKLHGYAAIDLERLIAEGWAAGFVGSNRVRGMGLQPGLSIDSRLGPPLHVPLARWGMVPVWVYATYYQLDPAAVVAYLADLVEQGEPCPGRLAEQWYIDPAVELELESTMKGCHENGLSTTDCPLA